MQRAATRNGPVSHAACSSYQLGTPQLFWRGQTEPARSCNCGLPSLRARSMSKGAQSPMRLGDFLQLTLGRGLCLEHRRRAHQIAFDFQRLPCSNRCEARCFSGATATLKPGSHCSQALIIAQAFGANSESAFCPRADVSVAVATKSLDCFGRRADLQQPCKLSIHKNPDT